MLKDSKQPPLYEIEVPVLHQKTHAQTFGKIWLRYFRMRFSQSLFQINGMSDLQQGSFLTKTAELNFEASTTMPLRDRSESIAVISLNFPGQTLDKYKRLRIPLCVPRL